MLCAQPELVQPDVGGDELLVDPAVRPARVRAPAHHRLERGVGAGSRSGGGCARSDRLTCSAVERDDPARVG